jgi:hypothetical protein
MTGLFKFRIRGQLRAGPLRRLCNEPYAGCVHLLEYQSLDLTSYGDEAVLPNLSLVVGVHTYSEEEALHLADRVGVELCPDEFLLERMSNEG